MIVGVHFTPGYIFRHFPPHRSYNNIGDTGAKLIVTLLRKNRNIHTLHLQKNAIGPTGAVELAHVLWAGSSLACLNLSYNPIADEGIEVYMYICNYAYIHPYIYVCYVCAYVSSPHVCNSKLNHLRALQALSEPIAFNNSLEILNIASTSFGKAGTKALGNALNSNKTLELIGMPTQRFF